MATIRNANPDDVPSITAILNEYIAKGFNGIFRTEPYAVEERREWFTQFKDSGPHQIVVAVEDNKIVGAACSFAYRGGGVFSRTVETSIYVSPGRKTKGLGTMLYTELFTRIRNTGLHLAVVGIALPNVASVGLHRKLGFEDIGVFREYAYFNEKYVSSLWMQKRLSEV